MIQIGSVFSLNMHLSSFMGSFFGINWQYDEFIIREVFHELWTA